MGIRTLVKLAFVANRVVYVFDVRKSQSEVRRLF